MLKVNDKVMVVKYNISYEGLIIAVRNDPINEANYLVRFDNDEDYFTVEELIKDN